MTSEILLWLLAVVGLALIWLDPRWKNSRGWLLGFFAASTLAVFPDFYFRQHYFLILLPALALLAGAAVSGLRQWWDENRKNSPLGDWPVWTCVLVMAITGATNAQVWFLMPPAEFARNFYPHDPLFESESVAKFIRENSSSADRVAVLGSEPEIYFLSRRHSATGYIYIYALLEAQPFALKMQREMIGEIESQKPAFVVVSDYDQTMNRHPASVPNLFGWWDDYQTNYTRVGVADVISPTETKYVFGAEAAASYSEAHHHALEIFRRETGDSNPVKNSGKP